MTETDEAVQRFLDGEEDAFSGIVRCWEKRVYSLAWRILGNREDAQDVVQETFLSIFKSVRNLRDPGSFPAWIYQITLNHCRARWRNRAPETALSAPIPDRNGNEEGSFSNASRAQHAGDAVETADLIRKALASLSEDHRTAVVLKEYMGLSLEELATVMDCPLSTAKSRLYHGLRGVQRNLKRMGFKVSGS